MTLHEAGPEEALTAYELQVLIGTSISGCVMSPDRVFDLKAAWSRLYSLGLIDRTDGIACPTPAGEARIASALASLPAPQGPAAQVSEAVKAGFVLVPSDDDTRSYSDSILPDDMIEAGTLVLEQAAHDLANYVPGETIDWDFGMEAVAVFRAMVLAAPQPQSPDTGAQPIVYTSKGAIEALQSGSNQTLRTQREFVEGWADHPLYTGAQGGEPWNGPGEFKHEYQPDSAQYAGDCAICGHTYVAHHPAPAQGAEPVQPVAARVAKFARSLHLANWTSALLAAYNPTGSAKVAYEDAKAALVADLTALAQPQVSREARK